MKLKPNGSMKQEVIDTDGNGALKVPPSAKLQRATVHIAKVNYMHHVFDIGSGTAASTTYKELSIRTTAVSAAVVERG